MSVYSRAFNTLVNEYIKHDEGTITAPLMMHEVLDELKIKHKFSSGYMLYHSIKTARLHIWLELSDGEAIDPMMAIFVSIMKEQSSIPIETPAVLRWLPSEYLLVDGKDQPQKLKIMAIYSKENKNKDKFWEKVHDNLKLIRKTVFKELRNNGLRSLGP